MLPMLLPVLALGVMSAAPVHPPVGAAYKRTISLPVIGKQTVELVILSDKLARIMLSGRLMIDEPVSYSFSEGKLSFELSQATKRLLRRFRTSLEAAGYDGRTDTSWVDVWPPLPLSVRIRLSRVEKSSVRERRWPQLSFDSPWRKHTHQ